MRLYLHFLTLGFGRYDDIYSKTTEVCQGSDIFSHFLYSGNYPFNIHDILDC